MTSDIHSHRKHLYTVSDLLSYQPPPVVSIVSDGVLEIGTRLLIFGEAGSWKSAAAIHLAFCLSRGSKWLGFRTNPANVLYIQGEMTMTQTKKRVVKYCNSSKRIFLSDSGNLPQNPDGQQIDDADAKATDYSFPDNVVVQAVSYLHLDESSGFESIKKDLQELIINFPKRPTVLIVDPLFKMFRHDLIREDEVKYFTDNMDLLIADPHLWENSPGLAVVIVHHSRKSTLDAEGKVMDSGSDDMFGSGLLSWWSDAVIKCSLDLHDETKSTSILKFTKTSRVAEGYLPHHIILRWSKDLLHPRITARPMPKFPEDETETRGGLDLTAYE